MIKKLFFTIAVLHCLNGAAQIKKVSSVKATTISGKKFKEIEAENYSKQSKKIRKGKLFWYKVSSEKVVNKNIPDTDEPHLSGASGNAYLELLPERGAKDKKLVKGVNFCQKPGVKNILSYKINFEKPGRYYIWVKAYFTNGNDNSIHVGIDGSWPNSGKAIYWCEKKKNKWAWSSDQRAKTDECMKKSERIYIDVPSIGFHTIEFSMRESGFEFDKWGVSRKKSFVPGN